MSTVSVKKIEPLHFKLILISLGLILGAFFSLSFLTINAYAAGNCPPGTVCGDTGGGDNGGGDTGGGGTTPPEPTYTAGGETVPTGTAYFSAQCANWNGSGSWQQSANCNNTVDSILNANPRSPKTSTGRAPDCIMNNSGASSCYASIEGQHWNLKGNETCGPNGNISAFKQNWSVQYTDIATFRIVQNADGTRRIDTYRVIGTSVDYSFLGCSYPEADYQFQRCYWNFGGNVAYSLNRQANLGSWNVYYNRPYQAGDPGAPGGAPDNGRCTGGTGVNIFVGVNAPVDELGYYSTFASYNHRLYTNLRYIGDGVVYWDAGWSAGGTQYGSSRNYFTYTCQPGLPNAIQGPYGNQGSIPNVDAYTNPATCPQVTWQCAIETPTTIGLDRTAVITGSISPNTTSTVMRNGQKVNIDFSRVKVIDTSTPNDIDITDGGTAPSIRNIKNIEYQTNVKPGSTPFLGTDPNAGQQYFKYYQTREGNSKELFNNWLSHNNSNLNKAISFNWASDSSSSPFQLQRTYRVTADFYIPGGSTVGSGGQGGNPGYQWKEGTYQCRDYFGRGGSRVDRGPLTATSNPVEVVRSANK